MPGKGDGVSPSILQAHDGPLACQTAIGDHPALGCQPLSSCIMKQSERILLIQAKQHLILMAKHKHSVQACSWQIPAECVDRKFHNKTTGELRAKALSGTAASPLSLCVFGGSVFSLPQTEQTTAELLPCDVPRGTQADLDRACKKGTHALTGENKPSKSSCFANLDVSGIDCSGFAKGAFSKVKQQQQIEMGCHLTFWQLPCTAPVVCRQTARGKWGGCRRSSFWGLVHRDGS